MQLARKPRWRPLYHLEQAAHPVRKLFDILDAQRQRRPPMRTEDVYQERCRPPVHVLEQQRGTARLDHAVRDLGDLEIGVDRRRDPFQLSPLFEERNELAQVLEAHRAPAPSDASLRSVEDRSSRNSDSGISLNIPWTSAGTATSPSVLNSSPSTRPATRNEHPSSRIS